MKLYLMSLTGSTASQKHFLPESNVQQNFGVKPHSSQRSATSRLRKAGSFTKKKKMYFLQNSTLCSFFFPVLYNTTAY